MANGMQVTSNDLYEHIGKLYVEVWVTRQQLAESQRRTTALEQAAAQRSAPDVGPPEA